MEKIGIYNSMSIWALASILVLTGPSVGYDATVNIIVDNQDSNTTRTGTWSNSSGPNPYNGQSLYNNGGSIFRWIPDVTEGGEYKVYAWWTYHQNRSTNVPYRVTHAAGTDTLFVNMHDQALGGQWNLLGTYTFHVGTGGNVEVSSENGQACADAVRFEKVVQTPSPSEVIVDNQDANTSRAGNWSVSSGSNPYNGESLYNNGGSTFRWTPTLQAGTFKVYAWWTYHQNRSTNVPYRVTHAAGTDTVFVNMHDSSLGGQWNLLGTYSFPAGSGGYVEVSSENGQACADAVRFVPDSGGDTTPPDIQISTVALKGTVSDAGGGPVTVSVNSQPANVNGGQWTGPDLPVASGSNAYTALAEDQDGNQASVPVQVEVTE